MLTQVGLKPLPKSLAVAGACVHVCTCVWENTEKPKEQPEQCAVFVIVEKSPSSLVVGGLAKFGQSNYGQSIIGQSIFVMCCCGCLWLNGYIILKE